jgi:hypothetical protein
MQILYSLYSFIALCCIHFQVLEGTCLDFSSTAVHRKFCCFQFQSNYACQSILRKNKIVLLHKLVTEDTRSVIHEINIIKKIMPTTKSGQDPGI